MHDAFWLDYQLKDFLFKGLNTSSITGFLLLCISLIVLAIVFEGLKVVHAEAKIRTVSLYPRSQRNLLSPHDSTTLLGEVPEDVRRKKALYYLTEVSIYVIQVVLGYLLMLSVMTYNGYVSMAILFGFAAGYAIFGQVLVERRIRNTQLSLPCQHCLQSEGKGSLEVTVIDDETSSVGCCSQTPQAQHTSQLQRD